MALIPFRRGKKRVNKRKRKRGEKDSKGRRESVWEVGLRLSRGQCMGSGNSEVTQKSVIIFLFLLIGSSACAWWMVDGVWCMLSIFRPTNLCFSKSDTSHNTFCINLTPNYVFLFLHSCAISYYHPFLSLLCLVLSLSLSLFLFSSSFMLMFIISFNFNLNLPLFCFFFLVILRLNLVSL